MKYLTWFVVMFLAVIAVDAMAVKVDKSTVINISTVSMDENGELLPAISGTLTGIEAPPKGDYQIFVTNGNGYKKDTYSLMECNILPLQEIRYAKSIPLSTTFTLDGKIDNVLGFYSGSTAFPAQGYKVVIKNGGSRSEWNTMNCRIK